MGRRVTRRTANQRLVGSSQSNDTGSGARVRAGGIWYRSSTGTASSGAWCRKAGTCAVNNQTSQAGQITVQLGGAGEGECSQARACADRQGACGGGTPTARG